MSQKNRSLTPLVTISPITGGQKIISLRVLDRIETRPLVDPEKQRRIDNMRFGFTSAPLAPMPPVKTRTTPGKKLAQRTDGVVQYEIYDYGNNLVRLS